MSLGTEQKNRGTDHYGRVGTRKGAGAGRAAERSPPVIEIMPGRATEVLVDIHEAGQTICLREFVTGNEFSAGNVISALEQGLAVLYPEYNPRIRNGYHGLDPLTQMRRSLDFMDYCIPLDHPDIVSGKVEVTNART